MADLDLSANNASNATVLQNGPDSMTQGARIILQDIDSMKAYLVTKDATAYSASNTLHMTKRDLAYACVVAGVLAYKSVTSIALSGTQTVGIGATRTYPSVATYEDGTTATVTTSAETTYQTSSGTLATVTNAGVITGVGAGTPAITATYRGKVSAPRTIVVS